MGGQATGVREGVLLTGVLTLLLLAAPGVAWAQDCTDTADPEPLADCDDDSWSVSEGDCDDFDDTVSPGEDEVCDNAVDDNCDGDTDEDCDDTQLDGELGGGSSCYGNRGWALLVVPIPALFRRRRL